MECRGKIESVASFGFIGSHSDLNLDGQNHYSLPLHIPKHDLTTFDFLFIVFSDGWPPLCLFCGLR